MNRAEALRIAGAGNPLPQGQAGEQHEYILHLVATAMVRAEMPKGQAEVSDRAMTEFPGYVGQVQLGRAFESAAQQMTVESVEHSESCPCRTKGAERSQSDSAMQTQGQVVKTPDKR